MRERAVALAGGLFRSDRCDKRRAARGGARVISASFLGLIGGLAQRSGDDFGPGLLKSFEHALGIVIERPEADDDLHLRHLAPQDGARDTGRA